MQQFHSKNALYSLREKGVGIPSIDHVLIGQEVSLDNISKGSTLHPFCQIKGESTQIYPSAQIGLCGPTFIENSIVGSEAIIGQKGATTIKHCTVGRLSVLGSGEAEHAVFLGKETTDNDFTTGVGFRVRKGSLYEEDSSSAQHTDTKMTILFPWATLGSNINFCDALLSGGTSPKLGDFSEVGSGTIHFNFTPYGDKATASLFGNIIDGLFLNQKRIFIGGNNSLIGPIEASFASVSAAGARLSHTMKEGLNFGGSLHGKVNSPFQEKQIHSKAIVNKQINYFAEISALLFWYDVVRDTIAQGQEQKKLYQEGRKVVLENLKERHKQILFFLEKNTDQSDQKSLQKMNHLLENTLTIISQHQPKDQIFETLKQTSQQNQHVYTKTIQSLKDSTIKNLHQCLKNITSEIKSNYLIS